MSMQDPKVFFSLCFILFIRRSFVFYRNKIIQNDNTPKLYSIYMEMKQNENVITERWVL